MIIVFSSLELLLEDVLYALIQLLSSRMTERLVFMLNLMLSSAAGFLVIGKKQPKTWPPPANWIMTRTPVQCWRRSSRRYQLYESIQRQQRETEVWKIILTGEQNHRAQAQIWAQEGGEGDQGPAGAHKEGQRGARPCSEGELFWIPLRFWRENVRPSLPFLCFCRKRNPDILEPEQEVSQVRLPVRPACCHFWSHIN